MKKQPWGIVLLDCGVIRANGIKIFLNEVIMNNVIWKFELQFTDMQILAMPVGAKILDVQMQNGNLQLWALCDNEMQNENRKIAIYGTGNPVPSNSGEHIATFQMSDGNLVFHVFEIKRRSV